MKRGIFLLLISVLVMGIVCISNIAFVSAYRNGFRVSLPYPSELYSGLQVSLSKPSSSGKVIKASVIADDARTLIVEKFIRRYRPDSPILPHASAIVYESDRNNIDFRLIPAIGMCESNLGKRLPSSDSYNAWGIAVYTNTNKGKHFEDWPSAIAWVAKFLREKFYDRGITDLNEIGSIWAPPSVENNYSWSRCVRGFMEKME